MRRLDTIIPRSYKNLDSDSAEQYDGETRSDKPKTRTSYQHVAVLYATIIVLLITQLLCIARIRSVPAQSPLGSYETGFKTEIRPDRNTLTLHKVKFFGGVVFDENGTASVSHKPGEPEYFGPPGAETENAWEKLLNDRFVKVEPKDWPPEAIQLLKQDMIFKLFADFLCYHPRTSGFHVLHCLNYVRKSLSPGYYTHYKDQSEQDPKSLSHSGHLKHCLEQIRQNLMCHLDMTPTPRTWRPAPAGTRGHGIFHADTDQWHVCRNYEAMRTWMYPFQEYHTGHTR
ncbi:hypothetical protein OIDMADRAFT_133847 [Oidiodendron maius Zn]|uniref:DUF3328 domain-containing protein n=1 Tax=Oidiodendron maius (strain Zn) TaxID=913774 RepID=A0A0C3GW92_OIDMZ|nr:hypothetical protein OIDMADRAFT_133847 [Oidiodendron maius Zn]